MDHLLLFAASDIVATVTNVLSVVLGLGAVIFFHEMGHFAVAKWCDVHVERFSMGIGPIIWSRQKGETEYALSALPFGGYVKMLGQDDMDPNQMTSDEIAENPRSFSSKPVWQRMAIISAGVIMNVITGFMFFAASYWIGVLEIEPIVGSVMPGAPAWTAGLEPGDRITDIDGEKVTTYNDIQNIVVLSSDSMKLTGTKANGDALELTITPEKGEKLRTIGINPPLKTNIDLRADGDIVIRGSAAGDVKADIQRGDRIIAMNGEKIAYLHDMKRISAILADQDISYTIERFADPEDTKSEVSTITVIVPPKQIKSLGLRMAMGPVTALQTGSLAEKAGLKKGDVITKVNDLMLGEDLDPLRLPNHLASLADTEVVLGVKRQTDNGMEDISITVTPEAGLPPVQFPILSTDALIAPSIGAGFHVQSRIAVVEEGSEASQTTPAFAPMQQITKVELQHANPKDFKPDALGDEKGPEDIDLEAAREEIEEAGGKEMVNWAWVFRQIQTVPLRQVRLHVTPAEDNAKPFAVLLKEQKQVEGWFSTTRGIGGFQYSQFQQTASSFGEAMSLGYDATKTAGMRIYMTLNSLFTGNLSYKALSGPLGIAKIGYLVADSGFTKLLGFLGFLSINLAILNFLPIPILDGGHMVFLIYEAVARRPPSPRVINFAHGVGLIFIVGLFMLVMYLDIWVNRMGY
ncbi:MAG: site-2 protease family protein [Fuerstiella sp.]